jgi:hypothetical protein
MSASTTSTAVDKKAESSTGCHSFLVNGCRFVVRVCVCVYLCSLVHVRRHGLCSMGRASCNHLRFYPTTCTVLHMRSLFHTLYYYVTPHNRST